MTDSVREALAELVAVRDAAPFARSTSTMATDGAAEIEFYRREHAAWAAARAALAAQHPPEMFGMKVHLDSTVPAGEVQMRQGEKVVGRLVNVEGDPDPLHLSRILHELAGAVSVCWDPNPSGVFESERAIAFVESAIAEIRQRHKVAQEHLAAGLAAAEEERNQLRLALDVVRTDAGSWRKLAEYRALANAAINAVIGDQMVALQKERDELRAELNLFKNPSQDPEVST